MVKEISSEDRNGDWGQLKSPMIMFGPKLERYNPGTNAGHGGTISGNKADTVEEFLFGQVLCWGGQMAPMVVCRLSDKLFIIKD